jgi:putative ABC transport system substrate-binding protein
MRSTQAPRVAAFVRRLHELGWNESRTVAIEYRWAEGRSERYGEIAAEFARLKVDVIVTPSTPGVVAATSQRHPCYPPAPLMGTSKNRTGGSGKSDSSAPR